MADLSICSVDGCNKPTDRKGFCTAHYWRNWKHGDPLGGKKRFAGDPADFFFNTVIWFDGDECLIWPYPKKGLKYSQFWHGGKARLVHRYACELINGQPPSAAHEAAHSCGNHSCVNPTHLRWATSKENQADRYDHGTMLLGEKNPLAKLTETEVLQIRRLKQNGVTTSSLAMKFNVSDTTIRDINRKKTWRHI